MRKKLETVLCLVVSALLSFYITLYILKETEIVRAIFASFLIELALFGFLVWIFELIYARETRKNKKHKKSIDKLSLE